MGVKTHVIKKKILYLKRAIGDHKTSEEFYWEKNRQQDSSLGHYGQLRSEPGFCNLLSKPERLMNTHIVLLTK